MNYTRKGTVKFTEQKAVIDNHVTIDDICNEHNRLEKKLENTYELVYSHIIEPICMIVDREYSAAENDDEDITWYMTIEDILLIPLDYPDLVLYVYSDDRDDLVVDVTKYEQCMKIIYDNMDIIREVNRLKYLTFDILSRVHPPNVSGKYKIKRDK